MSHPRKQIRAACVQSLIAAGITAVEAKVFSNRAQAFFGIQLPAINIVSLDESTEPASVSDAPQIREFTLAVDCYLPASENLDDEMDDLADEVESVMAQDDALGDKAISCRLSTTAMDLADMGEEPVGVMRLVYLVTYLA